MIESLLSGGVVGLLGSLVSNVFGYFKSKQEHQQQLAFRRLDAELAESDHRYALEQIRTEAEYKTQQLQIESERAVSVAEHQALVASYESDKPYSGSSRLLLVAEFMRRITRPVLTFLLVFFTMGIYISADSVLRDLVVRAVIAMTATVVAWWFADRQIAKQIGNKVL